MNASQKCAVHMLLNFQGCDFNEQQRTIRLRESSLLLKRNSQRVKKTQSRYASRTKHDRANADNNAGGLKGAELPNINVQAQQIDI